LQAPSLRIIALSLLLGSAVGVQAAEISGVVSKSDGGVITSASVGLWAVDGDIVQQVGVNASGEYLIDGIAAGDYTVFVSTFSGDAQYIQEQYNDRQCNLGCTQSDGDIVSLTSTEQREINFTLQLGGSISGVVTEEGSETPIEGGTWIFAVDGSARGRSLETDGTYSREGLIPGEEYWLQFEANNASSNFVDEVHPDVPCPDRNCDVLALGTPVQVTSGDTTFIDAQLSEGATIEGSVTESDGMTPIEGRVQIRDPDGSFAASTSINSDGTYSAAGLLAGDYKVWFDARGESDNYIDELHDDIPCPGRRCDLSTEGDLVSVAAGGTATIDAQLSEGFSISGMVTDAATGLAVPDGTGVEIIDATDSSGNAVKFTSVVNGQYSAEGLPNGDYKVLFFSNIFVNELYDDIVCQGCSRSALGDVVTISGADVINIDAALEEGGAVEGIVVSAADGTTPIEGRVQILDPDGSFVASTSINFDGTYSVGGLLAGDYKVWFDARGGSEDFVDELHENIPCPGLSCNQSMQGDLVSVAAGGTATIDAQLSMGATIQGQVVSAIDGTTPIEGWVEILQTTPNSTDFVENSPIEADGSYSVDGLPTGDYKIWFNASGTDDNFIDELHANVNCPQLACDERSLGTTIQLASGQTETVSAELSPGAEINGTLTRSDTSEPIAEASAFLWDEVGNFVMGRSVDSETGEYRLSGLVPGDYKLRVDTFGNDDIYIDQMFDGIDCVDFCDPVDGTTITLTIGEQRVIDMTLTRGLLFFGRVSDEADSSIPVIEGRVEVYDDEGNFLRSFFYNDADGNYQTGGLLPGDYKLIFEPTGQSERYIEELFEDISCPGFCDVRSLGTVVSLFDQDVNIDAALARGRLLTGRIVDNQGSPITEYISVQARLPDGPFLTSDSIFNQDGTFSIGVPDGEYLVFVNAFGERESWIDQYHDGLLCGHGFCDFSTVPLLDATASDVDLGDISLTLGGDMVVRAQANTADPRPPVSEGTVRIIPTTDAPTDPQGNPIVRGYGLSSEGERTIAGLEPGDYFIGLDSRQSSPVLVDEIFDDIPCPSSDCSTSRVSDLQGGTPFPIISGEVSEAVFVLDPEPSITISGTVVDGTTGTPLAGITVSSVPTGQSLVTDGTGAFSLSDLPLGTNLLFMGDAYLSRVLVSNFEGGSVLCPLGDCYLARTDSVATSEDISGVEVEMQPGARLSGALALPDGSPMPRFRTQVRVFDDNGFERFDLRISSNQEGAYETEVPPGGWHLLMDASGMNSGLIDTALGQAACPEGSCGMTSTTLVEAAQGDNLTGLDVQLLQGVPIAGSILDEDSSPAVAPDRGLLSFYDEDGDLAGYGFIDNQGNFLTPMGFPPGSYFASTIFQRTSGLPFSQIPPEFIDELYDNIPCLNGCDFTTGDPIVVGDVSTTPELVNIGLTRGSSISGVVTGPSGEVSGVRVNLFDVGGEVVASGFTDENGLYEIGGLLPDTYFAATDNSRGLEDELFDNILCEPSCNPASGETITVGAGEALTGIDFQLEGAASLAGRVLEDGGAALESVRVEIFNAVGTLVTSRTTNADGDWIAESLAGGNYFVRTRNSLGLVDKAYSDLDCNGCVITNTDPIELMRGEARTGIDLTLATGGVIDGTVSSTANGPVFGVTVNAFDAAGEVAGSAQSATDGSFRIDGLAPGDYSVATQSAIGLVDELWSGLLCEPDCTPSSGSAITLDAGTTETISFELDSAGRIAGTVSDTAGNQLANIRVQAFDGDARLIRQVNTGTNGEYQLGGIPAGDVFVRTDAQSSFTDQTWQGFDCNPICDVANGTPVSVTAGDTVTAVNFSLTPGSGIAGTARTTAGDLLATLKIDIFNNLGQNIATATTDAGGAYRAQGLADGRYFVRTRNTRSLVDEVFEDISCTPGPCIPGAGEPVDLAGGIVPDIDFELAPGSSFSGTATDQFNNPLPFGEVVLFDTTGREVKRTEIRDGDWTFSGVAAGSYFLVVQNGSRLVDELFDSEPCPRSRCDVTQGTSLTVGAAPATVAQKDGNRGSVKATVSVSDGPLDISLEPGSLIRGRVNGPDGAGIAGAEVTFFNDQGEVVGSATANGAGEYESESAFSEGTYFAATTDLEQRGVGDGLVNALFDGASCALKCNPATGKPIVLDAQSDADNIDFELAAGGGLTGIAVDDLSNPLPGATIEVFGEQGRLAGAATVDSLGNWKVDGLPDGEYTVVLRTDLFSEFTDFVIGAGRCSGDCDPAAGATFTVSAVLEEDVDPIELIPEAIIFRSDFE